MAPRLRDTWTAHPGEPAVDAHTIAANDPTKERPAQEELEYADCHGIRVICLVGYARRQEVQPNSEHQERYCKQRTKYADTRTTRFHHCFPFRFSCASTAS